MFAFLYCLTSATSLILVSRYVQDFNPAKLIFYNFLFTAIFFIALTLPKLLQTINLIKENFMLVFLINIATIAAWITTFYSLK